MPPPEQNYSLKVCQTCRHWVYRHKGLCERLDQGVGKFWYCEDWKPGNPENTPEPEFSGNRIEVP